MKKNEFKPIKGMLLKSNSIAILVTGPGDKNSTYDCFSGVVVMSEDLLEEVEVYPVGTYSTTWATNEFKKSGINISKSLLEFVSKID